MSGGSEPGRRMVWLEGSGVWASLPAERQPSPTKPASGSRRRERRARAAEPDPAAAAQQAGAPRDGSTAADAAAAPAERYTGFGLQQDKGGDSEVEECAPLETCPICACSARQWAGDGRAPCPGAGQQGPVRQRRARLRAARRSPPTPATARSLPRPAPPRPALRRPGGRLGPLLHLSSALAQRPPGARANHTPPLDRKPCAGLVDVVDLRDKAVASPCMHAFCEPCISRWLGHHKRVCPLCKARVEAGECWRREA